MKIVITNVPAFNGEYPFDDERDFTGTELHVVKQIAGLRANEVADAARAGDYDLHIALAVIALLRNEKINKRDVQAVADLLLDTPVGSISDVVEEEPVVASDSLPPLSKPEGHGNGSENSAPSGQALNGTGDDHQATIPVSTGSLG